MRRKKTKTNGTVAITHFLTTRGKNKNSTQKSVNSNIETFSTSLVKEEIVVPKEEVMKMIEEKVNEKINMLLHENVKKRSKKANERVLYIRKESWSCFQKFRITTDEPLYLTFCRILKAAILYLEQGVKLETLELSASDLQNCEQHT